MSISNEIFNPSSQMIQQGKSSKANDPAEFNIIKASIINSNTRLINLMKKFKNRGADSKT